MDTLIQASEANRHFSRILREVADGARFTITADGRPIARLVPAILPDRAAALRALLRHLDTVQPGHHGPFRREDAYD